MRRTLGKTLNGLTSGFDASDEGEEQEAAPPPGPPERLALLRERAQVIAQRKIAKIARGVAADREALDQEISAAAKALAPEPGDAQRVYDRVSRTWKR